MGRSAPSLNPGCDVLPRTQAGEATLAEWLQAREVPAETLLPALLTLVALFASGGTAAIAAALAVVSAALGLVIERWLFFAEAKHTVTLYYGAEAA